MAIKSGGVLKIRPPLKRVVTIPLDAVANAILTSELIFARISLIKNVLPVSPGASKKRTPSSFLLTVEQKDLYTSRWSTVSKAALHST